MRRLTSMVTVIFAVIVGALTIAAAKPAGAAGVSTRGNTSQIDGSGIDGLEDELADVTLDGRVLFSVRGWPAYPAEERARTIRRRIEEIAADPSVVLDSLRTIEMQDRTKVMAGDHLVAGFIDADGAVDGVSRQLLAERAAIKVKEAIAVYRNDRNPRVLLINTLYALGATAVLALVLLTVRRAFRKLDALAARRLRSRIKAFEERSHQIVEARQMRHALQGLLKSTYVLALLVLGYIYLHFVFGLYPWTRPLAARLLEIFLVTRYILRLTRLYFESIDRGAVTLARFDREWALPTYKITRLVFIALALVVAYPYIPGSSSEAFKGVSIFLGIVVSLGSSSVIANLMAGYTMIYRRAFKLGDRITVDNLTGDVIERRLMVTHLRTIKNEEIIVPNSTIINSNIINYSTLARSHGLILHTTVGIGYETPWRQVEAMLKLAAERTSGLVKEPAPFVLQKSLGDFAVTYELNAYCDNPHAMAQLYTAMHQNVLDVFNEHGVQIMTPAYEGDPEKPKVVPKDQWYQAPATPAETLGPDGRKP
jgi:small-conductance mechanosensitive channel